MGIGIVSINIILLFQYTDRKLVLQFRCNHKIIRNLQTKTEHNLQTQNYP